MFLPLAVGRQGSRAAVESALNSKEKTLLLVAQRDAANEQPGLADLFSIGTRAVIKKMARAGENVELLVQGIDRVELLQAEHSEPFLRVQVRVLPTPEGSGEGIEASHRAGRGGRPTSL